MKKLVKLCGVLFLTSGMLFVSCSKDDPETPPVTTTVPTPTALTVGTITDSSAILSWTGTIDSYELLIGTSTTPISVTASSYTAKGLTANTDYTWKVRAVEGSNYSDWASSTFKTLEKGVVSNSEVNVTFGDISWTAGFITASEYPADTIVGILAAKSEDSLFPVIKFYFLSTGTSSYVYKTTDTEPIFQYWEASGLTTGGTKNFGDWWAYQGTLTVTSNSNSKVSGHASVTMFNAEQLLLDKNPSPEMRTLTLTFTDVEATIVASAVKSFRNSTKSTSSMLKFRKSTSFKHAEIE